MSDVNNNDRKIPSPDEIRKEFERFAQDKFGNGVQFQTMVMPGQGMPGQPAQGTGEEEVTEEEIPEQLAWEFDLTPKQVKKHLDRFVIKQDDAKKALAIAVCDHYNHVKACYDDPSLAEKAYAKQNVLMLGPTGVGKTYLVRQIAKLIGVPFVKADATRFTEAGFVGANVDDLIRDLVSQANGNIREAEYGIIYLDEADKLAGTPGARGRDVSGRGVQFGLLKLMEETEVDLRSGNDMSSQIQTLMEFQTKGKVEKRMINTRHILFIVSGAFTGLNDIIQKRLDQRAIGIAANPQGKKAADDNFKHATTQDFVEFGFEPEFVGRLPVRVNCEFLEPSDLMDILKDSEESIILQYQRAFESYGIQLNFEDAALQEIAEQASLEKTGARALMTVCERILRDFKFELPSTDITSLKVTADLVRDPKKALDELLKTAGTNHFTKYRPEVRAFEKEFAASHGLNIRFSDEAIAAIGEYCEDKTVSASEYLGELLGSYEHGLNLVKQNTGQSEFEFGVEVLRDAKAHLESLIKNSYS